MLSAGLQEIFANNRRLEKPAIEFQEKEAVLSSDQYESLIASVLENRTPVLNFTYCKELGISSTTAYLAKIYLDIILAKSNFIDHQTLQKTTLCCVWIATKLIEPAQLSSGFSPQVISHHGFQQFSAQEIIDLEIELLEFLDYRLNYTTPYDYIQPFFQTFPWLKKVKTVIGQLIDFAMTLSELADQSSEYVFYSCFLAICLIKQVALSPLQKSILSCQVSQMERVYELTGHIVEAYNKIETSEEENLGVENIQIELE